MTVNDQKKLVKKILTQNFIPKIGYHSKWFENVGVDNVKDYQKKFEAHLNNKQAGLSK